MSKLYEQLKNAAFSRREALERKSRRKSSRSLAEQKVVVDSEAKWREEIEDKLQAADQELTSDIREREATMATLAEAAQRRAEAEAKALERVRGRQEAAHSPH